MEKFVVANWKQNKNLSEVESWLEAFVDLNVGRIKDIVIVIGMSYPYLYRINLGGSSNVYTAAQNVSMHKNGAHTGEVGAKQLKDFCKFCIVGHSERSEDFETVQKKIDNCYSAGIIPIICFVNPNDAKKFYRQGALLAWEDPENISKEGVFNPKWDPPLNDRSNGLGMQHFCPEVSHFTHLTVRENRNHTRIDHNFGV